MTENLIKIPRRLVYNYNEETKKVEDTIMNTIEYGGIAIATILYLDARCCYRNHFAFTLERLMTTLGITPTKGKNGTTNRVKNVFKALEEHGILKFYKPIDKCKLDTMIECEITFTFDKEDGEDVNWFSIPHSHINKILDEVPSKDVVNCLIIETIVQGRKFNGFAKEPEKSSKDKNYPGCAKLSWGYIKPNVTKAIKSKNTWHKCVSILESIGLLYTVVPVANGEKQSKIYGYSQNEVNYAKRMIEFEAKE